jgi:RNA recognition motif-containing protein
MLPVRRYPHHVFRLANRFVRTSGAAGEQKGLVMGTKLYVGNLPYTETNQLLEKLFAAHGEVRSAEVIMDREAGRSKGFGFVEMADSKGTQAAMAALNGKDINGRQLTVNEARPKEEHSSGGHGGGRGGYGSGRRY